jgi:hypothetical protein
MAILAIHTDCFKLLILAISCKNLGDEYPDTTGYPTATPNRASSLCILPNAPARRKVDSVASRR